MKANRSKHVPSKVSSPTGEFPAQDEMKGASLSETIFGERSNDPRRLGAGGYRGTANSEETQGREKPERGSGSSFGSERSRQWSAITTGLPAVDELLAT